MTVSATRIADSISPSGIRMTSLQVTMHRFVLPEFNTHRAFSRSFRSSRAVPVTKLLAEVRDQSALPVTWQANKPGMQGGTELAEHVAAQCEEMWQKAAGHAADFAEQLMGLGLHKSWANRLLEPFLYVHGVVTSTTWTNFFGLRRHPDAQPEIRALADAMWEALQNAEPQALGFGEWHLPYVLDEEIEAHGGLTDPTGILRKVSAARCARTSYKTHDGQLSTIEKDVALYERLLVSRPLHASPAEHQATPDWAIGANDNGPMWARSDLHGNLYGWRQHRKFLPFENITAYQEAA